MTVGWRHSPPSLRQIVPAQGIGRQHGVPHRFCRDLQS